MPIDMMNKPKKQGTGFVNLQSMLQASRPQKLAQTIGTGLQSGIQQSRGAIQSAKSKFGQQLGQTKLGEESKESSDIQNILSQDPTQVSQGQEEYLGRIGQGYTGPKGLEQVSIASSEEAANLAQTPGGRTAALQKYLGRPGYTSGQQRFDQLLLGKAGAGAFKQAKLEASKVRGEKTAAETEATTQAGAEQEKATRLKGQAEGLVSKQAQDLQTILGQRQAQTQANLNKARETVNRAMAGETLSPSEYQNALSTFQALGVDVTKELPVFAGMEEAQRANFLGAGPRALGAEDVASEQERQKLARIAALGTKVGLQGQGAIKTLGEKQAYDPFALSEDTRADLSRQAQEKMSAEQATPQSGVYANTTIAASAQNALTKAEQGPITPADYKDLQGEDRDTIGWYQNNWRNYTGGVEPNTLDQAGIQRAIQEATKEGLRQVMNKRNAMVADYQKQVNMAREKYRPRSIQDLLKIQPKAVQTKEIKWGK